MIADYYSEIKIATFQSIAERQCAERSSFVKLRPSRITCFNSVNCEIIGRKPAKFVHDVAGLLSFNLLKAALEVRIVQHSTGSKPVTGLCSKRTKSPKNGLDAVRRTAKMHHPDRTWILAWIIAKWL